MNKTVTAAIAVAIALTGMAGTAAAQREPGYAEARAAGQVGEKMDGYIGIVGPATGELQRVVNDINIKRRAVYAQRAQAARSTLEEFAFTAGCLSIARTSRRGKIPGTRWIMANPRQWSAPARCTLRGRLIAERIGSLEGNLFVVQFSAALQRPIG